PTRNTRAAWVVMRSTAAPGWPKAYPSLRNAISASCGSGTSSELAILDTPTRSGGDQEGATRDRNGRAAVPSAAGQTRAEWYRHWLLRAAFRARAAHRPPPQPDTTDGPPALSILATRLGSLILINVARRCPWLLSGCAPISGGVRILLWVDHADIRRLSPPVRADRGRDRRDRGA